MCPSTVSRVASYWYPGAPDQEPAKALLEALRDYRTAEQEMRRRIRDEMNITEKDMLALRHVLHAHQRGNPLGPTDLSRLLSISSASTTALIDRLVSSGHVRRQLHPTDRRALKLIPTDKSSTEIHETLGRLHERMMEAASSLSHEEAEVVTRFLHLLQETVEKEPAAPQQGSPLAGPS